VAKIARLGLERAERIACVCCLWVILMDALRAATSYTKREMGIKLISRRADLKNRTTLDDHFDLTAIPSGAALLLQNH
jgi:hypothetical protein